MTTIKDIMALLKGFDFDDDDDLNDDDLNDNAVAEPDGRAL